MKKEGRNYYAEKGNFIVRKADGFIMGEDICLGSADSIENYKEEPYTEESYRAFYESIGMEVPGVEQENTRKDILEYNVRKGYPSALEFNIDLEAIANSNNSEEE